MAGPTVADLIPQQELYNAQVFERYQSSQKLKMLMQERMSGGAGAYTDWVGGKTEMTEIPFGAAEIATSAINFTPIVTVPLRFVIKTAVAEADQSLTNVDVREQHARVHGQAAGRMIDILKLRAIFNNPLVPIGTLPAIPKTVGPTTGLTSQKLVAVDSLMNDSDVPSEDRTIVANSDQFSSLFLDSNYNNSRISGGLPLKTGDFIPYVNMQFLSLAKNATNSIPVTAVGDPITAYTSYAGCVQFDAMKMEYNIPVRTVLSYDETNLNYVIVTELVANAQIIQKDGVALINLELDTSGNPIENPVV